MFGEEGWWVIGTWALQVKELFNIGSGTAESAVRVNDGGTYQYAGYNYRSGHYKF